MFIDKKSLTTIRRILHLQKLGSKKPKLWVFDIGFSGSGQCKECNCTIYQNERNPLIPLMAFWLLVTWPYEESYELENLVYSISSFLLFTFLINIIAHSRITILVKHTLNCSENASQKNNLHKIARNMVGSSIEKKRRTSIWGVQVKRFLRSSHPVVLQAV